MAGILTDAEIASMAATVTSSLDITVTVRRKASGQDAYGHASGSYTSVGTAQVNIIKPSASDLQAYADIIGSQLGLMLRFMPTSDIREGDQIVYKGKNWMVHGIMNSESYTFANEAMITVVT